MKKRASILASVFAVFFSCSSGDDIKSSENYIEEFSIGVKPAQVILKHDQNLILISTIQGNKEALSEKIPAIKVSEKASLSNSGGNWTDSGFSYTVAAENGDERKYTVQIAIAYKKYSFETWSLSSDIDGYWVPSDSNSIWTSGNAGISMALAILKKDANNPESYPTRKTEEGHVGNAALMETIEGGTVFGRSVPLFSGNFLLGNFNAQKAITDELAATEVGSIYHAKPKTVRGWYKYKEGPGVFIEGKEAAQQPGRSDSCNLHISFYQGDSPSSGKDTTLTVKDIDDSELVIADATMEDCSETKGDDFHEFKLDFVYKSKEPDFENHYYKIAITFAASRRGDNYGGKIGSRLIVDEVEIEDY